jgi:hypothetical protein
MHNMIMPQGGPFGEMPCMCPHLFASSNTKIMAPESVQDPPPVEHMSNGTGTKSKTPSGFKHQQDLHGSKKKRSASKTELKPK